MEHMKVDQASYPAEIKASLTVRHEAPPEDFLHLLRLVNSYRKIQSQSRDNNANEEIGVEFSEIVLTDQQQFKYSFPRSV